MEQSPTTSEAQRRNLQRGHRSSVNNCTKLSEKALSNLRRVVAKGFEEGDLHLLNLCEVGGHMQGLSACHIEAATVVDEALKENEYGSEATQAYMLLSLVACLCRLRAPKSIPLPRLWQWIRNWYCILM